MNQESAQVKLFTNQVRGVLTEEEAKAVLNDPNSVAIIFANDSDETRAQKLKKIVNDLARLAQPATEHRWKLLKIVTIITAVIVILEVKKHFQNKERSGE